MNTKNTYVFDIQASEPYTTPEGEKRYRDYVNLRLHVLTGSVEAAIELFREAHPDARIHQVIRRTNMNEVIVDPKIWVFQQRNAVNEILFEAP